MKSMFIFDFISGMSLGIEFFWGDTVEPGDKFAMVVDLLIIRITYVLAE